MSVQSYGGRPVVLEAPRVFLNRRMADAVRTLNHDGAEVRTDIVTGRPFLRCDDLDGFRDAIREYRSGPAFYPLHRDVLPMIAGRTRAAR